MNVFKKRSILVEVAIFFILGVILTGSMTYFTQRIRSTESVTTRMEMFAAQMADEVNLAVKEYPAHIWLMRYWYEHPDEMDIEYDVDYGTGTRTEEKCRILTERYPGIQLKYVTEEQLNKMPAEDQKLYAEIAYSWLITRINQIKRTYKISFLFCVLTDTNYIDQFFLFSAADEGAVRGTNYEEVYTLGVEVQVAESQQEAMRSAYKEAGHLADAGNYMDYYSLLDTFDDKIALIGLTYDLSAINKDILDNTIQGTAFAMFFQILVSIICLMLISMFVLNPLRRVQFGIRKYSDTKDSSVVEEELAWINSKNEIGELAHDVKALAKDIDEHVARIETITAEKERIGTELEMANQIQSSMLPGIFPAFPDRDEFDIYATMEPAKEVGGDFYDFFLIDNDHLAMVIADVSGKGIPAALFMMASKIIIQSSAMLGRSPAEVLTRTNDIICSNNKLEMFVTVWIGILEISTGKLTACSAGHEYPAVRKPDGCFEILRDKHGFVVGGMPGLHYKEYELQLEPGSKLFLYTDGVPEATDGNNDMFGTDRMIDALNVDPAAVPDKLIANVRSAVGDFVKDAEQFDDLTMLCFEYRGADE